MKIKEVKYMKIQEYEIMNEMMKHTYINQRELAEITGYSVGKVNLGSRSSRSGGRRIG